MGGGEGGPYITCPLAGEARGWAAHSFPTRPKIPELAEGFSWPVRPRTGHAAVLNLLRVYGKMSLIKEFSRDPAGGTPAPAHVRQEEPPCVIMLTDL